MNKQFDILLISTCCNHEHIYSLINSVLEFNNSLSLGLIIVNQFNVRIDKVVSNSFSDIIIIEHGKNENSSVARNIGIDYLVRNNFNSKFVCFPDDDSTFDAVFFNQIHKNIKSCHLNNTICEVYCEGTKKQFKKVVLNNGAILTKRNFGIVGAVNIIVNFSTFKKVLHFDTRFGVNAKYGAGEDGDYFIRAVGFEPFYYNNEIYNYHPSGESKFDKLSYLKKRRKLINYGKGGIALLCKHRMYLAGLKLALRALGGFFYFTYKLKFLLAIAYLEAFFVRLFFLTKFVFKSV